MERPGEAQLSRGRDRKRNMTRHRENERDAVNQGQKKVFQKWVNLKLKHRSNLHVVDLFEDVQDGRVLCALVDIFGGTKTESDGNKGPEQQRKQRRVSRSSSGVEHNARDRIARALEAFRNLGVKLENINAADVAKGNPTIVLGLIWQLILHFEIEVPAIPRKKVEGIEEIKSWVKDILKRQDSTVKGIEPTWRNGYTFLALIEHVRPGLVKWERANAMSDKERLEYAFDVAENCLNVSRLLQPEDVDIDHPDEQSIMTYVALIRNPPERQEDTVDATSSRKARLSGNGKQQRHSMDQIEKMTSTVKKLMKQIQETGAKLDGYLSPQDKTKEKSLTSLRSTLSRVKPQLEQQVKLLSSHLDEQLQQTQSLSGALRHVEEQLEEEQLEEEEPPGGAESEESPRSIVRHLHGRLEELKKRLQGSVIILQPASPPELPPTASGATSILSGASGQSFAWSRNEQALHDLLGPRVNVATQTFQDGDNSDLQNLLKDLRESLEKLRGLLDRQKSTRAAGGDDQARKDFVGASTEFLLIAEKIYRLSACVKDNISLYRSLQEAEVCLHDKTQFQQQAGEERPNVLLRQVEDHAASAQRRLLSLEALETRAAYISLRDSIRDTLRGQQAAVHYLREAVIPPQHCLSSLEQGQLTLRSVHSAGSDLLVDLQGNESPATRASADTDQASASLQVLFDRAEDWIHDAVDSLEQVQQPLQAISQFHENIDNPELRSSVDEAVRDAQESERLIQDWQQPHSHLRQRRSQHREEREDGGQRSGARQGRAEESRDSLPTVLAHTACLLLLLYFWFQTIPSLF